MAKRNRSDQRKPKSAIKNRAKPRTIVYIDGFNMYYGTMRGTGHRWLNIQRYFELLRTADDIVKVHYFTAQVTGSAFLRQETYLRALDTCSKVNIVLGKYKIKTQKCKVTGCQHSGSRQFPIWAEKRTDVNIAIQMMDDAYRDESDNLILVSGDSDLVPALYRVKLRFPKKKIIVYVPARNAVRGAAVEIRSAADKHATLPLALLPKAQFPPRVPDGSGGYIEKPAGW